MLHRRNLVLLILTLLILTPLVPAQAESTISCSSGKIDILDWMTLDADLRSNFHMTGSHDLYTVVWSDKFYWLKNVAGDTWDIQLYDNNTVYQWITERVWNEPFDYKRFDKNTNVPMSPRCVSQGYPGNRFFITDTSYRTAEDCIEGSLQNLGKALMEVWGPYTAGQPGQESSRPAIGGQISDSTPVHVIAWLWNCDSNHQNCGTKEEFVLTQRHGLVRHNSWKLVSGSYQLNSRSTFNTLAQGTTTPFFPCF